MDLLESMYDDPIFKGVISKNELPNDKKGKKGNTDNSKNKGRERRDNKFEGDLPKKPEDDYIKLADQVIVDDPDLIKILKDAEISLAKATTKLKYIIDSRQSPEGIVKCIYLKLFDSTLVDYDVIALGGNVNEIAYFDKKVNLLFTDKQSVNYKGGEDGRRAFVNKTYGEFVKYIKKAVKYTKDSVKDLGESNE